jgi:predicted DNA-binding transcriptional regulator AlpA
MKEEIVLENQIYETGGALSARLGVCSVTIYRWMRRGLLPAPIKIGSKKYYCRDEVEAFLSRGQ